MIRIFRNAKELLIYDREHDRFQIMPCDKCKCSCDDYLRSYNLFSLVHYYAYGVTTKRGTKFNSCDITFNGESFRLFVSDTAYNDFVFWGKSWYSPERPDEKKLYKKAKQGDVCDSPFYTDVTFVSDTLENKPLRIATLYIRIEYENVPKEYSLDKSTCGHGAKTKAYRNTLTVAATIQQRSADSYRYNTVASCKLQQQNLTAEPLLLNPEAGIVKGIPFKWDVENLDLTVEKDPYQDWVDSRENPEYWTTGDLDLIQSPDWYDVLTWIGDCNVNQFNFNAGLRVSLSGETGASINSFSFEDTEIGIVTYLDPAAPEWCAGDGEPPPPPPPDSPPDDPDDPEPPEPSDPPQPPNPDDPDDPQPPTPPTDPGEPDAPDPGEPGSPDPEPSDPSDPSEPPPDDPLPPKPNNPDHPSFPDPEEPDDPEPPDPGDKGARCTWLFQSKYENGKWSEPEVVRSLGCQTGLTIFDNEWVYDSYCGAETKAVTTSEIGCVLGKCYSYNDYGQLVEVDCCTKLNPPQPNPPNKYPMNFSLMIDTAHLYPFISLHSEQYDEVVHTETDSEGNTYEWYESEYVGDGASIRVYESYYGNERPALRQRWMIPVTTYSYESGGQIITAKRGPSCSRYSSELPSQATAAGNAARSLLLNPDSYDWASQTTNHWNWDVHGCSYQSDEQECEYGTRYHDCYNGSYAVHSWYGRLIRLTLSRNANTPLNAVGVEFLVQKKETVAGRRTGEPYSIVQETEEVWRIMFGEEKNFEPATEYDMVHIVDPPECSEDCYKYPDGACLDWFDKFEGYAPGCCERAGAFGYYCEDNTGSLWTGKTEHWFNFKLKATGYILESGSSAAQNTAAAISKSALLDFSVPLEYDNFLKNIENELKEEN